MKPSDTPTTPSNVIDMAEHSRQAIPARKQSVRVNNINTLTNAIAAMIEDEDCPPDIYNDLTELVETWRKRYEKVSYPKREAARIRATLPEMLTHLRGHNYS